MSRDEAKLVLMKETGNDDTNDTATLNKQQKYNEELEEFLLSIYEYWKTKRLNCVIILFLNGKLFFFYNPKKINIEP
jgi:hypothetical protein